ncbi:hypothetical protein, partial [Sphingopyxis sp. A083]|uniref:hypothetical protein n=1 Tax=Sphingopyxis sp. A083 TaxID=1759083 RepID=UPI001E6029AE
MIDAAPQMPPLPTRPVAEAIVDCGVNPGTFTISYEDDLQGNMIVFARGSGANERNLGRVDKRDSQARLLLIQDCFLRSSHGSRGFVGC